MTEKTKLAVLINGQQIFGITPIIVKENGSSIVTFDLTFSQDNIKTWSYLYYKSRRGNTDATIELASINDGATDSVNKIAEPMKIYFSFITGWRITFFLAAAIILSLTVIVMASRYGLLRDSTSYSIGNKTYSLGRTQFACWSVVMLAGWLWIYSITWSGNGISGSMLVIWATSIGALGAGSLIDSAKKKSSVAEKGEWVTKIAEPLGILSGALNVAQAGMNNANKGNSYQLQGPSSAQFIDAINKVTDQIRQIRATAPSTGLPGSSNGLIDDISTDVHGLSMQRVQMIVTNVAAACYVLLYVFWNIDFPQLSETTLGLIGLSSGAYAGLKMGEKHS